MWYHDYQSRKLGWICIFTSMVPAVAASLILYSMLNPAAFGGNQGPGEPASNFLTALIIAVVSFFLGWLGTSWRTVVLMDKQLNKIANFTEMLGHFRVRVKTWQLNKVSRFTYFERNVYDDDNTVAYVEVVVCIDMADSSEIPVIKVMTFRETEMPTNSLNHANGWLQGKETKPGIFKDRA